MRSEHEILTDIESATKQLDSLYSELRNLRRKQSAAERSDATTRIEPIIRDTFERFELDYTAPEAITRKRRNVFARQVALWRMKKLGFTHEESAAMLSDVLQMEKPLDHSTVTHSIQQIENYFASPDSISKEIAIIVKQTPEFKLSPYGIQVPDYRHFRYSDRWIERHEKAIISN